MKIDIETLRKTKGIGQKTLERIIKQHHIDNGVIDKPLYIGAREIKPKIYNDDALKILENIKDDSVDMIYTDPPYKTTSRGSAGNSGGMLQKDIFREGCVFEHNDIEPELYIPQLHRVLKDGGHCYIMTNHVNLINMLNTATNTGFHFIKSLIWDKGNKIMGQAYMSQYEYILFFRKGRFKKINHCGTSDIISIPNKKTKDSSGNNLHDTEKPVGLTNILIKNSSQEGDIVLDPFMGIGGAGVSCKNLNRKFIGIELDEKYFNIAKDRIHNHERGD